VSLKSCCACFSLSQWQNPSEVCPHGNLNGDPGLASHLRTEPSSLWPLKVPPAQNLKSQAGVSTQLPHDVMCLSSLPLPVSLVSQVMAPIAREVCFSEDVHTVCRMGKTVWPQEENGVRITTCHTGPGWGTPGWTRQG
jgi:hypothetical protein